MEMRITGWRYRNIRGGLRNVAVELGSPPPRWALIQMPNGTGKTTTMTLLRAVLTGDPLDPETIRDLRPTDETDRGEFELQLRIDDKAYHLYLGLDYREGKATYRTSRAALTGGGMEEGLGLPAELRRLITPRFARLFIFDGELAKEIRKEGMDRAADAVRTLYRLDRLRDLGAQIARLVDDERQRAAANSSAETPQGLRNLQSRFETAKRRLADLEREAKQLDQGNREDAAKVQELEARVSDRISEDDGLRRQMEEVTQARQLVESQIAAAGQELLSLVRHPAVLHRRVMERLRALGGKMDHLKLPKTISLEFFDELAEAELCICGRAIGDEERTVIRARAHEYLAENQIAVINAMKSAVRYSDADPAVLDGRAAALAELVRERQRLATRKHMLEEERLASGDAELESLREQLNRTEQRLRQNKEKHELLTTTDRGVQGAHGLEWDTNVALCRAEMDRRGKRWDGAMGTRRFLVQARRTDEIIRGIEAHAFDLLCERVRERTNEILRRIAPSEALHVSRLRSSLELASDGLAAKGGVSEGQSLAVAYAFLTALFQDAPYRLPFVVDSPAISLDTRVRREVGDLVPGLFDQMIMFVISSERPGFADTFYSRDGVRYVTLWKQDAETTIVSDSLEVFRTFHDETEPTEDAVDERSAAGTSFSEVIS
ncbi:MAG TPA: hypothetical protein VLK84_00970 [Longimicrobium sp.]|nr:hypothetical protein [Longimicrobium sp.]